MATLGYVALKNLLISGSKGLVGRTLIPHLYSDFRVHEIDRENLNVKFLKAFSEKAEGKYHFIHLAWPVSSPDYLNSKENTRFLNQSKVLMQFLINDHNCDLIFGIGSILEHGDLENVFDDSPVNPLSLYAQAKCELADFLRDYGIEKSRWLRIGYQVSAFDPPTKLVPTLLVNANSTIPLREPNKELDLIHRYDVASAILHFSKAPNSIAGFSSLITTGRSLPLYKFANEFLQDKIVKSNETNFAQYTHPINLKSMGWMPKYVEVDDLAKVIKLEASSNISG